MPVICARYVHLEHKRYLTIQDNPWPEKTGRQDTRDATVVASRQPCSCPTALN